MGALRTIKGRTIVAAVILTISCFIITNTLIESRPISVIIEGETPKVIQTPLLYGEMDAITLTIASWIAGLSSMYLYLETSKEPSAATRRQETSQIIVEEPPKLEDLTSVNTALKVLREPGKTILEVIVKKGGELLQNDLSLETGFSKAKISRTLRELEARNIIQRKQYGSTKRIMLTDWMKKEPTFKPQVAT